eukprot:9416561-Lingulodinium_polyedra.AAC.1
MASSSTEQQPVGSVAADLGAVAADPGAAAAGAAVGAGPAPSVASVAGGAAAAAPPPPLSAAEQQAVPDEEDDPLAPLLPIEAVRNQLELLDATLTRCTASLARLFGNVARWKH